jgi:hypothetical protein
MLIFNLNIYVRRMEKSQNSIERVECITWKLKYVFFYCYNDFIQTMNVHPK